MDGLRLAVRDVATSTRLSICAPAIATRRLDSCRASCSPRTRATMKPATAGPRTSACCDWSQPQERTSASLTIVTLRNPRHKAGAIRTRTVTPAGHRRRQVVHRLRVCLVGRRRAHLPPGDLVRPHGRHGAKAGISFACLSGRRIDHASYRILSRVVAEDADRRHPPVVKRGSCTRRSALGA
jgi:hypothetical protein